MEVLEPIYHYQFFSNFSYLSNFLINDLEKSEKSFICMIEKVLPKLHNEQQMS